MAEQSKKICLVVPCYNEEKRLNLDKFKEYDDKYYFLFVNDGSLDNTLLHINKNKTPDMYVLNLEKNSGKAEAVRLGMLHLKTLPIFDELEWAGFWDADLSTDLAELDNFLLYSRTFYPGAEAIWGSRVRRLGSKIDRTYRRHILGRLFASVISGTLGLKCYDSQCGAKLFKKELIDTAYSEKFISPWIFDVEILLRLKGHSLVEYPLYGWYDVKGSKIKFTSVAIKTLIEIRKIRKKYLS